MLFTIFKFPSRENAKISQVMMSYTQPCTFWPNMMKKDISANLYQNCLILCSKILLNVFYNKSLTVLLPWQPTGIETSPMSKVLRCSILIFANYRLTHSASEFSGFTSTSSLTMNEKFQYRTRPLRAVLKISSSLLVNECR